MSRATKGVRRTAYALLLLAAATAAQGLWIPAKAALAQVLLDEAFARGQAGEPRATPWPWSDAWPVARLRSPRHGSDLVVLSDASGRSLAFGPGHLSGTPLPGDPGTSVIAGHRDTHFAFLRRLEPGDALLVERGQDVTERLVVQSLTADRAVADPPRVVDHADAVGSELLRGVVAQQPVVGRQRVALPPDVVVGGVRLR